ncbi:MAG: LytTR family transcriptional regulator [Pseudorhodobacter sp. PARRP1]|nr:MAG: LytTR family transcriptional regulator [Pseudorhodobacter sp. PARRP1]
MSMLAFTMPWLLWGLIAIPILWLLLRAIPPAPIRRRFPAVALLLGLTDEDRQADKTPWWLLLLRALAVAAAIIGFAGPILNPENRAAGTGPLVIILDGGWADARDWPGRLDKATNLLTEAGRAGRPVAVIRLTDLPQPVSFQNADAWTGRLAAMEPQPFAPQSYADWLKNLPDQSFDSYWLSDGLDHPGRDALLKALQSKGNLTAFLSPRPVFALRPAAFEDGKISLTAARLPGDAADLDVIARGPDPSGIDRELARSPLHFDAGAAEAKATLDLPPELRNRVNRFELLGQRSAGAVSLTDDSLKRRKIAVIGGTPDREGLPLLQPTYYLRQALTPVADLVEGGLSDVIPANPDVIILADVAKTSPAEADALLEWVNKGGLLLRFAGPRLAASELSRADEDPLMPVRLREGGRSVGGAMSWGEPKTLAPFPENSPFHGLAIPDDVTVTQQVLAQPDPDLSSRTIAALADGTPLVTRREIGAGQVVLVHVTANAEWSNLPLTGLFVQMLERLAVSTKPAQPDAQDLVGLTWVPQKIMDGYGTERDAGEIAGIEGANLAKAIATGPGPGLPAGLYASAERKVALNVIAADTKLTAATWPSGVAIEGIETVKSTALKGVLLTAAMLLLALDVLAALWVSGRIGGVARGAVVVLALMLPHDARAQVPDDIKAIEATRGVVLAYVETGDAATDQVSEAGMRGLSDQLWLRTAVEPEMPIGVDLEKDDLAFYPFLYWPITANQPLPSTAAYAKLNRFLRTGGMILFDTRDGDIAGYSGDTTPEGQMLQLIAAGLDIPPLEPMPKDHVLTRSFYLLQDFPGRYAGGAVWVEASDPEAEKAEGMPFRNLNDGVTPVIIGSADWASAWATDTDGVPMFPVGRGYAGEDQREISYRFGINVIMHVLTGNYKSDQVHVPALLERLGE